MTESYQNTAEMESESAEHGDKKRSKQKQNTEVAHSDSPKSLNRRNFLQVSALTAASALGAGLTMSASGSVDSETFATDFSEYAA